MIGARNKSFVHIPIFPQIVHCRGLELETEATNTNKCVPLRYVPFFAGGGNAPVIVTWVPPPPPPPIGANVGICTGFDTANWVVVLSFDYTRAFDTEEADRRSVRYLWGI